MGRRSARAERQGMGKVAIAFPTFWYIWGPRMRTFRDLDWAVFVYTMLIGLHLLAGVRRGIYFLLICTFLPFCTMAPDWSAPGMRAWSISRESRVSARSDSTNLTRPDP